MRGALPDAGSPRRNSQQTANLPGRQHQGHGSGLEVERLEERRAEFEIPDGPCVNFSDANGNGHAIL